MDMPNSPVNGGIDPNAKDNMANSAESQPSATVTTATVSVGGDLSLSTDKSDLRKSPKKSRKKHKEVHQQEGEKVVKTTMSAISSLIQKRMSVERQQMEAELRQSVKDGLSQGLSTIRELIIDEIQPIKALLSNPQAQVDDRNAVSGGTGRGGQSERNLADRHEVQEQVLSEEEEGELSDSHIQSEGTVDSDPDSDPEPLAEKENDEVLLHPHDASGFSDDEDLSLSKHNKRQLAQKLIYSASNARQVNDSDILAARKKAKAKARPNMLVKGAMVVAKEPEEQVEAEDLFSKHFSKAPSFKAAKKSSVIDLDQQQVNVITQFYRSEHPQKLTAYSDESKKILKTDPKFDDLLDVPEVDEFVKFVVRKNAPHTANFTEGYISTLWRAFEKEMKKIHNASKIGILASAVNQKVGFNQMELLEKWRAESSISEAQFDEMKALMVAGFDSANRSLEQAARCGGLVHQLRRKVILEDLNIPKMKHHRYLNLPLSSAGILGSDFEGELENQVCANKQFKHSAAAMGLTNISVKTQPGKKRQVTQNHYESNSQPKKPRASSQASASYTPRPQNNRSHSFTPRSQHQSVRRPYSQGSKPGQKPGQSA